MSVPKRWIGGLCALIAIAILINVPSLDGGWFGDDYAHRRFILDHLHGVPSRVAFWNMFDWRQLGNRDEVDAGSLFGRLPWWAARDFSFALLRPLSTSSHFLDYLLWPTRPWLMHLHNVLLYCGVVVLAGQLFRRIFSCGLWALLPTLLFAIDDTHVVSVAWIASRNTVLTAAFVLLTLWLHMRRVGSLATALALLCAHACSEGAITAWAYLIAFSLTLDERAVRQRLVSLLPLAAVSIAWLSLSAALGYGVHGSSVYVDPRSSPGLFATVVASRMVDVLQVQLTLAPELAQAWSRVLAVVYCSSLAALVLVYFSASARIRFFALATVGALLPQCAGGSFSRLLLLSGFAVHGLVFAIGYELWSERRAPAALSRVLLASFAGMTLVLHGAFALDGPRHALAFSRMVDRSVSDAAASLPAGANIQHEHIFVLNFPDYLYSVFIELYRRELFSPGPQYLDVLGVTPTRVLVTRTTDTAIELSAEGGYLSDPSTLLVRTANDVFEVGDHFKLSNLDLDIVSVTTDGRPAVIRVSGPAIAQDSTLWFRWNAQQRQFVRAQLPRTGAAVWLD